MTTFDMSGPMSKGMLEKAAIVSNHVYEPLKRRTLFGEHDPFTAVNMTFVKYVMKVVRGGH
jgi:hypothetical protein